MKGIQGIRAGVGFYLKRQEPLTQGAAGRPFGRTAGGRSEKHLFGFQFKINKKFFLFYVLGVYQEKNYC
jgi:hypothetical protein